VSAPPKGLIKNLPKLENVGKPTAKEVVYRQVSANCRTFEELKMRGGLWRLAGAPLLLIISLYGRYGHIAWSR
jgi:hypothetical protein